MTTSLRWRCLALGLAVASQPATRAVAQDARSAQADSTRARAQQCSRHEAALQQRELTIGVAQALGSVWMCPRGPAIIAALWEDVTAQTDTLYVSRLASGSVLTHPRIAGALMGALADKSLGTVLPTHVLASVLMQLDHRYGSIRLVTVAGEVVTDHREQRPIRGDSTRTVLFGIAIGGSKDEPPRIAPSLRAAILAAIARVAADSLESADMRMIAGAVHRRLEPRVP